MNCKCGQEASNVGSSSSGSNSAPFGFDDGGSVRNRLIENWNKKAIIFNLNNSYGVEGNRKGAHLSVESIFVMDTEN